MTKIPNYFGDISDEEIKRIQDNTEEFEKKVFEFQKRENEDNSDDVSIRDRCKIGPRLKSFTISRIKT